MGVQAQNNSAQTAQVSQLSEDQRQQLIAAIKIADSPIAAMALNAFIKFVLIDMFNDLGKDIFALMHNN